MMMEELKYEREKGRKNKRLGYDIGVEENGYQGWLLGPVFACEGGEVIMGVCDISEITETEENSTMGMLL